MLRKIVVTSVFIPFFLLMTLIIIFCVCLVALFPGTSDLIRKLELIWAKGVVWATGMKLETVGLDLERQANYLFIGNHQSWLDIPAFLTALAAFQPRFVAKESLFRIPIFGTGMKRVGHLSINRENNRKGMRDIQEVSEQLERGESVLIFPEGTRNRNLHQLQDFHVGAFVLALKTEKPVVPVVVQGTGNVLRRGSLIINPGPVTIRASTPIQAQNHYTMKQRTQLKEDIRSIMQELVTETRE